MLDCLMTAEDRELRKEARAFVRDDLDKALLRDMDADKVRYTRVFLEKAAARGLPNLRRVVESASQRLDDWADRLGTIPYEIVCGISKRVPRVYDVTDPRPSP